MFHLSFIGVEGLRVP